MGFYGERVLPRIIDKACGTKVSHELRTRVCRGLSGQVVEIGFGSGHNARHYPETVSEVIAVEPSELAWRLARERVAATPIPVRRAGLVAERLPIGDDTADAALSTWTMCTIPELPSALAELRRVLRPGGRLHFLEHGMAPDERVRAWQHRLDGVNGRLAGGCHLNRPIRDLISEAGFEIEDVEVFYEKGAPKFAGALSLGVAVNV